MPYSLTAKDLSTRICQQGLAQVEAIVARYLPGFVVPPTLAGYPLGSDVRADLAYVLHHLAALGVESVAGLPVAEAQCRALQGLDGPATVNFYSYRIAETLRAYGPWEGNRLLAGLDAAAQENLRLATDSTSTWDTLMRNGTAANYWAVLARCEHARDQLGILADRTILDGCLAKVAEILGRNPRHYWDDSTTAEGVYDIYTADVLLFLEPLWPLLPASVIEPMRDAHLLWAEALAMENGTAVAWGRSTGLLGVCMTLEMHAMGLHTGLATDPARSLGLAAHAVEAMADWYDGGLVTAHRDRMTYGYRGPHRLLQMTLDCIGKTLYAARHLATVEATTDDQAVLWPARDEVVQFDDRNGAVWIYRDEQQSFQLPLIGRLVSDYIAGPRHPGVFETVVDSGSLLTGTPLVQQDGQLYASAGRPAAIRKAPGSITAIYDGFPRLGQHGAEPLPGRREVTWRAVGRGVSVSELWQFDVVPQSIELHQCEAREPLVWDIQCALPHRQRRVAVAGIREFRSFWGELAAFATVTIEPAREVRLDYVLRPATRVLVIPADHDYTGALYAAMPTDRLRVTYLSHPRPWDLDVADLAARFDVLHVGWPETLFARGEMSDTDYLARVQAFTEAVCASSLKLIWTMHNRRPHRLAHDHGHALYRLWAAATDGVIHHSEWGRDTMLAELPYRPDAVHIVAPHGHYGEQMPPTRDRTEVCRDWELPAAAIRYGVVGRPQAEKQVDLIARAFAATTRDDISLFVSAVSPDDPLPDDPRIRRRDRKGWLDRQEIAEQVQVCDALIIAVTGPTYLTSGQTADAIGAGIPMIAIDWPFLRETLGESAFYFVGSEADLAALLQRLTPADIAKAREAVAAVRPRFDWPVIARTTLDLIETVADSNGSRRDEKE